jgi:hypothetical protein
MARWKTNATGVASGILPLVGVYVLCLFFFVPDVVGNDKTQFGMLADHYSTIVALFLYLSLVVLFYAWCWAATSPESVMGIMVVMTSFSGLIGATNVLLNPTPAMEERYGFLITLGLVGAYAAIIALVIGIVWFGFRFLGYLRRNNLVNLQPMVMLLLIAPIAVIGYLFVFVNAERISFQWLLSDEGLLVTGFLVPGIVFPILSTPGAMHWYRHRR